MSWAGLGAGTGGPGRQVSDLRSLTCRVDAVHSGQWAAGKGKEILGCFSHWSVIRWVARMVARRLCFSAYLWRQHGKEAEGIKVHAFTCDRCTGHVL